jgi:hypothetical protein
MADNVVACDRDGALLLPPEVREWLVDPRAWFVPDVVDQLDLVGVCGQGIGEPLGDVGGVQPLVVQGWGGGNDLAGGGRLGHLVAGCGGGPAGLLVLRRGRGWDDFADDRARLGGALQVG